MANFDTYRDKYETVKLDRQDGILQVTFHTNGGPLQWGFLPHRELGEAFHDIGSDTGNRVVILTGTGDEFSGPPASQFTGGAPAEAWAPLHWEGRELIFNLLRIEAPMIAAINGPAIRHVEIPLLCDIVLASDHATFQDSAHFINGLVPGDGHHIILPLLMGWNRGRYFLLTGQTLSAQEALDLGLVNEVLPHDKLMARALEHAEKLAAHPSLNLRYTRIALTLHLEQAIRSVLGYGLALEGLAANVATAGDPSAQSWSDNR